MRCGQPRPTARVVRMSGRPSCQGNQSTNSTSEWTTLQVHQYLDAFAGYAEQVVGLDDFQALVHQRRRIDRDLRPHRPFRVGNGLGQGDLGRFVAAAATEWCAGGGQRDPAHAGAINAGIA